MANLDSTSKQQAYATLLQEVESVLKGETDTIARMANTAAMIHETFGFWWTGFYRVNSEQLVLGPFQGPLACMRIAYGKGVCGTAWQKAQTIVVPMIRDGKVVAVLDIDSTELGTFDEIDQQWLEKIVEKV